MEQRTGTASTNKPVRLTGVLVALVILGVVMFALPPQGRLWVALTVVTMALLVKGGDAADIIDGLRRKVYGTK
jgi:hypothetical protein